MSGQEHEIPTDPSSQVFDVQAIVSLWFLALRNRNTRLVVLMMVTGSRCVVSREQGVLSSRVCIN